jgi:hypothetical protein
MRACGLWFAHLSTLEGFSPNLVGTYNRSTGYIN